MIKIIPADDPRRVNRQEIMACYFNMLAEVVPFRPEDVLGKIPEAYHGIGEKPRNRTDEYKALLMEYGIPVDGSPEERRIRDAELGEKIIQEYSKKLHDELYGDKWGGGAVKSPEVLQDYFTAKFIHGNVPDNLKLGDKENPSQKTIDRLKKYVFPYDAFSQIKNTDKTKYKPDIYQFVSMLGVPVCPYCNRQLTSVVINSKKQIRPQLDHFRNKKDYPHLALCLNNLIPSCATCNLQKHDDDLEMLYPYDEGMDDSYVFKAETDHDDIVSLLTGTEEAVSKFTLILERNGSIPENDEHAKRADVSIDNLAISELYSTHKGYIADLFRQNYILTKDFYEDKKTQFPKLFKSAEDVKRTIRLMDYSPEKWGERPLAKLTHDISEQIDELNNET